MDSTTSCIKALLHSLINTIATKNGWETIATVANLVVCVDHCL